MLYFYKMDKRFLKRQFGAVNLIVMIIMAVLVVSLPIATKLVQQSQENRSSAAGGKGYGEYCAAGTDSSCASGFCADGSPVSVWKGTNACTVRHSDAACFALNGKCVVQGVSGSSGNFTDCTVDGKAGKVVYNLCLSGSGGGRCCVPSGPSCIDGTLKVPSFKVGEGVKFTTTACEYGCNSSGTACNACSSGRKECGSSGARECVNGQWSSYTACEHGCNGNVCASAAPTPTCTENKSCEGNIIVGLCIDGQEATEECTGDTPYCIGSGDSTRCAACVPGTINGCASDTRYRRVCNNDGVYENVICGADEECEGSGESAQCVGICEEGYEQCGLTINRYRDCVNEDGKWRWSDTETSCPSGKVCNVGDIAPVEEGVCRLPNYSGRVLRFTLKFSLLGVKPGNDRCVDDSWKITVQAQRAKDNSSEGMEESQLVTEDLVYCDRNMTNSKGEIVYCADVEMLAGSLTRLDDLALYLDGRNKHIVTKYGEDGQNSPWPAELINGEIDLSTDGETINLSEFPILVGDVVDENDIDIDDDDNVSGQDWAHIKDLSQPITFSRTSGVDFYGDLDGNCVVNSGDANLIKISMSYAGAQEF